MKEDGSRRPKPSPWPFTVASLLFLVLTWYLLGLYSTVHWIIAPAEMRVRHEVDSLILDSEVEGTGVRIPEENRERLRDVCNGLRGHSGALLGRLEAYDFTGLISFLCSVVAVLRRPRWVGIIALAFGILGFYLAAIVM